MIAFLHGKLVDALPTQVTVEVNGVGYEVLIPLSSFDKLPQPGGEVKLLTHLAVREDAHVLYGFMTAAERELFRLLINTVSGVTAFAQAGAIEALRGPQVEVEAMVAEFRARRDLVVEGLNGIPGFRCLRPSGAFYVFPEITGTGLTGRQMADRLLAEAGVCVLAGTSFGHVGVNHIRISYANSRENLTEALGRIRAFVGGLGRG